MRRGLVLFIIWVAFLTDLFLAAGLLLSGRPALRTIGVALILGSAGIMVALTLLYYVRNRRTAQP